MKSVTVLCQCFIRRRGLQGQILVMSMFLVRTSSLVGRVICDQDLQCYHLPSNILAPSANAAVIP
jgi:hypothetical protein